MPQLAVNMKDNIQNKDCRNLKINRFKCGPHHTCLSADRFKPLGIILRTQVMKQ